MKNCIIRAAFILTLLLTLGAAFGEGNSATAHAATIPVTHVIIVKPEITQGIKPVLAKATTLAIASKLISPNIYRSDCEGSTFNILADFDSNLDCFATAGPIDVTIYNVDEICTGNNAGYVIGYNDSDGYYIHYELNAKYRCFWLRGPGNYVNRITHIEIY